MTSDRGQYVITALPIPGGWTNELITLGSHSLAIALPANPRELLDQLETLSDWQGETDPFWARLWPSAVTMARIVVGEAWPRGQRAIELGCGVGVVGIAALLAGLHVTFTDYVPVAVELALENARRNGFPHATGRVLDWRQPFKGPDPFFGEREFILASDVLYDPDMHEPLLNVVDLTLVANGACWIGEPGRFHVESFLVRAAQHGYIASWRDATGREQPRPPGGEFQVIVLRR